MVLIIFTIMLLNIRIDAGKKSHRQIALSCITGTVMLLLTATFLSRGKISAPVGNIDQAVINNIGHTELIGQVMFTEFLLPFEITSILLLVAIVGAVILAKRKLS